jgi:hypothetical protein
MNLDYSRPYFNMSVAACRRAGGRGGRRSAMSRRLRLDHAPVLPEPEPHVETAAEAIARIDALCPWLRGAENHPTRRREA